MQPDISTLMASERQSRLLQEARARLLAEKAASVGGRRPAPPASHIAGALRRAADMLDGGVAARPC